MTKKFENWFWNRHTALITVMILSFVFFIASSLFLLGYFLGPIILVIIPMLALVCMLYLAIDDYKKARKKN